MAGILLDTPDRVLKRVQQLEMQELDLPSLPSFQHDSDYESGSYDGADDSMGSVRIGRNGNESELDPATPHPLRRPAPSTHYTMTQSTRQPGDTSTSGSETPYPPLGDTSDTATPYVPRNLGTSTPHPGNSRSRRFASDNETRSTVRYGAIMERTRSATENLGSSSNTGREKWHTPGEMSRSFSGEEIPLNGEEEVLDDLSQEVSLPLNDVSTSFENMAETPLTRRLSSSKNVLFKRPGRRQTAAPLPTIQDSSPSSTTPSSMRTALPIPESDRIPSLSRSEITQSSGGASTPEGPSHRVNMASPQSEDGFLSAVQEEEQQGSWTSQIPQDQDVPTFDYQDQQNFTEEETSHDHDQYQSQHVEETPYRASPAKSATPAFSTPGIGREPAASEQRRSFGAHQTPMAMMGDSLRDITSAMKNTPSMPFTPSPVGMNSKLSDTSTPRAPLNDAERRKSHVLAVLGSATVPSRLMRTAGRGTPHPLRHVSVPLSDDEASPAKSTPGGLRSHLTALSANANESFVSVASSADLTSDRRGISTRHLSSRGNTSFPTMLLPGAGAGSSPGGGSLRGTMDHRADGIKIHKHLNAMNKQLLETNADLAREAEAWRDEVTRLWQILQESGIEVEEVDVMAKVAEAAEKSYNGEGRSQDDKSGLSNLGLSNTSIPNEEGEGEGRSLDNAAMVQEMAERLEILEAGLDEKDQMIQELEKKLQIPEEQPELEELHQQIDDLEARLEESEKVRANLHTEFSHKTELHAKRFGEICSGFEEQVKDLETQLSNAKAEITRIKGEKSRLEELASKNSFGAKELELRRQLSALEVDLARSREEIKVRSTEIDSLRKRSEQAQEEQLALAREKDMAKVRLVEVTRENGELVQQAAKDEDRINELEATIQAQEESKEELESSLAKMEEELAEFEKINAEQQEELDQQRAEIEDLSQRIQELEDQLADTSGQRGAEDEMAVEVDNLRQELEEVAQTITEKDVEIEALRGKLELTEMPSTSLRNSISLQSSTSRGRNERSEDQASFVAAMEERLDEAYREIGRLKHELSATPHRKSGIETRDIKIKALEREKATLQDRLAAIKSNGIANASANASVMQHAASPFGRPTPFVHRAIASLKTPRTPGPLKDLSWLQTTIGDANEPIYNAQIDYLQGELKRANDQLDNNFSRLEAAGLGGIALAEKLAAAHDRIAELEDEIRALIQRNKASLALVSAHKKDEGRHDQERLKRALAAVHEQLESMKTDTTAEKSRLQKDNGRLQDLVSELRLKSTKEAESFKSEVERMSKEVEKDVRDAQEEARVATKERGVLQRDVQSLKAKVRELERDLTTKRAEAEELSRKASRANRDMASPTELAQKNSEINILQASLQEANLTINQLERTLEFRDQALQQSQTRVHKLESEHRKILVELEGFEKDLQSQRTKSNSFRKELEILKAETAAKDSQRSVTNSQIERECREAKERLRGLARELERFRHRAEELELWQDQHNCQTVGNSAVLNEQKQKFKAQARDLAVQIKYLKAKFTRESTFRNALALQKRYLLLLVGGMSLNEQATLKAIASMGYPVPEPPRKKHTLKAAGIAVLSLIRARNAAQSWRNERMLKANAVESYSERKRMASR